MWHRDKKILRRPNFCQHAAELSSQNETNTTVTSQGRSEEKTAGKQLCTDVIRAGEYKKRKAKKNYLFYTFFCLLVLETTQRVSYLFSCRRF